MTFLKSAIARFADVLAILKSAGAVAVAVEGHRAPRAADLRRLGIEPRAFNAIGRA